MLYVYLFFPFIALSLFIAFIYALNSFIAFHLCFKLFIAFHNALNTFIAFIMWIIALSIVIIPFPHVFGRENP